MSQSSPTANPANSLIGQILGERYVVGPLIGRGGMGLVYVAQDLHEPREVVIKMLAPHWEEDADATTRFVREGRRLAQLSHPNIVAFFDWGSDETRRYIVMEYIRGEALGDVLKRKQRLSLEEFAPIADQVLAAVGYAHDQAMMLRDIKPSNIMLAEHEGKANFVKMLDFGLAKLVDGDELQVTKANVVGTASYLAPELIKGERGDVRVDVYALGILFFVMLTGVPPIVGDNDGAVLYNHVHGTPARLRDVLPPGEELPAGLVALIEGCLAKEPHERPADAKEMHETLRAELPAFWFERPPMGDDGSALTKPLPSTPPPSTPPPSPSSAWTRPELGHLVPTAPPPASTPGTSTRGQTLRGIAGTFRPTPSSGLSSGQPSVVPTPPEPRAQQTHRGLKAAVVPFAQSSTPPRRRPPGHVGTTTRMGPEDAPMLRTLATESVDGTERLADGLGDDGMYENEDDDFTVGVVKSPRAMSPAFSPTIMPVIPEPGVEPEAPPLSEDSSKRALRQAMESSRDDLIPTAARTATPPTRAMRIYLGLAVTTLCVVVVSLGVLFAQLRARTRSSEDRTVVVHSTVPWSDRSGVPATVSTPLAIESTRVATDLPITSPHDSADLAAAPIDVTATPSPDSPVGIGSESNLESSVRPTVASSAELRAPGTATLSVLAPKDAVIEIDGLPVGTSKFVGELPLGAHEIRIHAQGYEPWSRNLEVVDGVAIDLIPNLEPKRVTNRKLRAAAPTAPRPASETQPTMAAPAPIAEQPTTPATGSERKSDVLIPKSRGETIFLPRDKNH